MVTITTATTTRVKPLNQDFRMARQDYREAQQDFARGDVFGGLQNLAEANEHCQDGLSHLGGGRGWI